MLVPARFHGWSAMNKRYFQARFLGVLGCWLLIAWAVTAGAEEVLEEGGFLRVGALPQASVEVQGQQLVVWGFVEVPGHTRLGFAQAGAEAEARAEFARYLEVRIESLLEERSSSVAGLDDKGSFLHQVVQTARSEGVATSSQAHGWRRVKREGEEVLQVVARLGFAHPDLESVLSAQSDAAEKPMRSQAIFSDAAPGWAHAGDQELDDSYQLVCEGQGNNPDEAMDAARAACEDRICRLCGVQIESVLETLETLDGMEMERRVVERCRRARTADLTVRRQSSDCGPEGCSVWLQVSYDKELQARECQRATEENYADPEACKEGMDLFARTNGFNAASMHERVATLDQAQSACAGIDDRQTVLMQALDERLKLGMARYQQQAPYTLAGYWLADTPALWNQVRLASSFVERLALLQNYLEERARMLDVMEVLAVDAERFDTPENLARLLEAMKAAPKVDTYDSIRDVQVLAVGTILARIRAGQFDSDVTAISEWMLEHYPAEEVTDWNTITTQLNLFGLDGRINAEHWAWAESLPQQRLRGMQMLLACEEHEGESRLARFQQVLNEALQETPHRPIRALEQALPIDACGARPMTSSAPAAFLLENESSLPQVVREAMDWSAWYEYIRRWDWGDSNPELRDRYVARLREVLAETQVADLDAGEADRFCWKLEQRLEILERHQGFATGLDALVCGCLEGPLTANARAGSVTSNAVYQRALAEGMACVH